LAQATSLQFKTNYYFSLNPQHPQAAPLGPVLELDNNESMYVTHLFGRTLQMAHQLAAPDFYDPNDLNLSYHTFLLLAVTVVYHESRLQHFRKVTAETCNTRVNSFQSVQSYAQ